MLLLIIRLSSWSCAGLNALKMGVAMKDEWIIMSLYHVYHGSTHLREYLSNIL